MLSSLLALLPFLASAQAFFILTQPVLLTTRLDPIVDPAVVGSHVHSIAGGNNFDRWMNVATTQASTCTTAPITIDKSNYWIPQLYYYNPKTTGYQAIPVAFINTYYLPRHGKNDTISAFPEGLRMVSGDPSRRDFNGKDVDDQAISYVCLDYKTSHAGDKDWDQRNDFFNHNCPDGLRAQVNFRTCWDGKNLDSPDHRSHMAWPVNGNNNGGGDCPASHPVKVVELFYEFVFETAKFPFNGGSDPTWVWANGDTTGYGLHADFLNGWGKVNGVDILQRAIDECDGNGGVAGNLEACPPFQGLINRDAARGCQPQNPLVNEDIGFGHEIPQLPGNNLMWIGDGTKPSIANYTESANFTDFRSVLPADWSNVGCIAEAPSGRALDTYMFQDDKMTRAMCAAEATKRGFPLAGVQFEKECWMGYAIKNGASNTTILSADRCNYKCAGNTLENCGGSRTLNLMTNPTLYPPPLKLQTGWEYQGCYDAQGGSGRILASPGQDASTMTGAICVKLCHDAGYPYAGVEFGQECKCSSTLRGTPSKLAETQCSMPCAGDSRYTCGAGNRVSLFKFTGKPENAPGASTSTAPAANPLSPAAVSGWYKAERNCIAEPDGRRALTGYSTANGQMSGAACMTLCGARGFAFAGTQWSSECYCGSAVDSGAKEAPMSECNMACSGASGEACGGSRRLTMYQLGNTAPTAAVLPKDWAAYGCWDGRATKGRAFTGPVIINSTMNNDVCMLECQARGFVLAGIEYGNECRCGAAFEAGAVQTPQSDCNMPCTGLSTQLCGAGNRMTTFRYTGAVAAPSKPAVANNTLISVAGWTDRGCYTEASSGRALAQFSLLAADMTIPKCLAAVQAKGYSYGGLEYSGECYGGNELRAGAVSTTEGCTMVCNGDKLTLCGGSNRLNVFEWTAKPASSSSSSSAVPAATTSASAAIPSSWTARGCYAEGGGVRAVPPGGYTSWANMTQSLCISLADAKSHSWAAVVYGRECFTGNALNPQANKTADTECSFTCSGDKAQKCGGNNRATVFQLTGAAAASPSPSSSSSSSAVSPAATPAGASGSSTMPAGWKMTGCIVDGDSTGAKRAFAEARTSSASMTQAMCASFCADKGYSMGGVSYSAECYCGNSRQAPIADAPDSQCNMPCSGNKAEMCGGSWRLNMLQGPGATASSPTSSSSSSSSSASATPSPTPSSAPSTAAAPPAPTGYIGCFKDSSTRQLNGTNIFGDNQMTNQLCIQTCKDKGFAIAGTTYGVECECGNYINRSDNITLSDPSACGMACKGASDTQKCGASWQLSAYLTGAGNATYYEAVSGRRRRSGFRGL